MSDDVMFGFGAMRLDLEDENNPSSINYDDVTEMIDYYMDRVSTTLTLPMHTTMVLLKLP